MKNKDTETKEIQFWSSNCLDRCEHKICRVYVGQIHHPECPVMKAAMMEEGDES